MARGNSKSHRPALQIESLRNPPKAHQPEKHQRRRVSGYRVKAAAGSHADGGFYKNRGCGGHSYAATRLFQNCSCTQEADALNDIRSDARAAGVAKKPSELFGEYGEQRGREADEKARAHARGTAF